MTKDDEVQKWPKDNWIVACSTITVEKGVRELARFSFGSELKPIRHWPGVDPARGEFRLGTVPASTPDPETSQLGDEPLPGYVGRCRMDLDKRSALLKTRSSKRAR